MDNFIEVVTSVNDTINTFVWVKIGLWLLISTGVIMSFVTGFFQVTHIGHWMKKTVGGVFHKSSHNKKEEGSVSQFQALCTALAATIGTGNIAGVAAAIVIGGPGAVFWMWVAAFFGMMTNYSENILGIFYRRKNKDGEWSGGAMYYLQDGLGGKDKSKPVQVIGKILAILFAIFAFLAAFGIGNMGQVNKITINVQSAFFSNLNVEPLFGVIPTIPFIIGIVIMVVGSLIIIGGLKRIAAVAEKVVPFMAGLYILGALIIIFYHFQSIGPAFLSIFKFAFGAKAIAGGTVGAMFKLAITQGCKRGVFSNEAGLGSSVMVHSNSDVKEPVKQGLWGIFEVFADTFVVCSMTALVVLTSGYIDLETGNFAAELAAANNVSDANLVAKAFGGVFGAPGEWFIAVAIFLFAFTTVLGWSHYGSKAVEYLIGERFVIVFRIIFVLFMVVGAIATSSLAWDISDTFNGMMMIPNLIGVLSLSPLVYKLTKNYTDRKIKGKTDIEPLLSYDPEIQKEHAAKVAEGAE
ncbi:MAG: alanine:cation symporter family protein [Lachnospiraceae bacterium]|nr:alanine:cation symporter family protein [Lachnospiraceae bacterium]